MSQTHFKHPSRHLAPIHTTPVAQRSEDNSILSSTTSMIVCDVDLNLDGQEFAASRREQRDPSRPVHGDAQRPTQRRSARRRPAAPSTATCSRCCGNARRGAPWRAQRMARARRTARALGPRLLDDDDRAVYCSCQKQTSYTFRGYVLRRDVTKFQGYTLLAV